MLPLVIAMQVAPAQLPPPAMPPPQPPPPSYGVPAQPPPPRYGMPAQPPPQLHPPRPKPAPKQPEVTYFGRMELGFGSRGFGENNQLLDEVGYGGFRFWATLDGGYMFHRHIGVGPWLGMNRRSSRPENNGSALNEVAYFVGGQVPVLIVGEHRYALHATPRLAFTSAQIELDNGVNAEFQNTAMFGGAVSFTSFAYHVSTSVAFMHAPAGPPGEVGRDHDYGGLYFTLGGTIDG